MTSGNHFDVIIIGSGAGGGTLASKLAPTGKRILLLERSGYVPREKDNWNSLAVVKDAKYNAKESWTDTDGKPLHPHTNYYVGGNTSSMARRCTACASATSPPFATTAAFRRHGLSATVIWNPGMRRPSVSITYMVRLAAIRQSLAQRPVSASRGEP